MPNWLARIIPLLRLARVTTAFAAVANVWFVILWTRAVPAEGPASGLAATTPAEGPLNAAPVHDAPLWILLLGGAASAASLYGFGTVLNDIIDRSRDRALRRDRPIAAGEVSAETAALAVAATLILSVLGATVFGTAGVVLSLALAFGVLVFNTVGKHLPALGLPMLAILYAAHMLLPNPHLRFLWPLWTVMTHALLVEGLAATIGRRGRPLSQRALTFAVFGWLAASAALLWLQTRRADLPEAAHAADALWPAWVPAWAWVGPAALAAVFAVAVARRIRRLGASERAAEKITRYGSLWLPLYGCAWLLAVGEISHALLMLAPALAGWMSITVLRELQGLIAHPVGYRR